VAVLDADPTSGENPLLVNFDASGSYDPDGSIDNYEWDFDGNGVFNETGEEADAEGSISTSYTYAEPGDYNATVRVSDDRGQQSTACGLIHIAGWIFVDLGAFGGFSNSLAVIDGCPAIASNDPIGMSGIPFIEYVRSSTPRGLDASDWSEPITMAPSSISAMINPTLVEVADHPAVSFLGWDGANFFRPSYVRATSATGASPEDWNESVSFPILFEGSPGAYCPMAIVDGNPAMCWGYGKDLYYVRATSSTGATDAEWAEPFVIETAT